MGKAKSNTLETTVNGGKTAGSTRLSRLERKNGKKKKGKGKIPEKNLKGGGGNGQEFM